MAAKGDAAVPTKQTPHNRFADDVQARKRESLHRTLSLPHGIDLSSNDYLGFAQHPKLVSVAQNFLSLTHQVGAAGSRLLRGHHLAHMSLERRAADIFDAPAVLYMANGFVANYGLMTTLPNRHDTIIYDEYVHASARDGIAASRAKSVRVAHNDLSAFEAALKAAHENRKSDALIWIVLESVYSMDGDIAPLGDIMALAEQYQAWVIVDEAHATGIFGNGGRGCAHAHGKKTHYSRLITLHTCGKALGSAGALICGAADVIDYMINNARPFIYSTAPLPVQAAMAEAALQMMVSEEGDQARKALSQHQNIVQEFGLTAHSAIVPLMMGDDARAVQCATALQKQGFDIRAIRPPTVPKGTARLRLSLSAAVSGQDLSQFLTAYKREEENLS